ncbi:hypothetical protein DL93DRAFT_109995 [Clavulina sp. PMI_390]|nr:hypothetical protein DL93DRAFT_109995 [Clavulina sp. PMI_390]
MPVPCSDLSLFCLLSLWISLNPLSIFFLSPSSYPYSLAYSTCQCRLFFLTQPSVLDTAECFSIYLAFFFSGLLIVLTFHLYRW